MTRQLARRIPRKAVQWLTAWVILLCASTGIAQGLAEPFRQRPRLEVELGGWISVGETRWSHNASGAGSPFGNPSSKLIYQDHATNITELTVKAPVGSRWFGRVNGGYAWGGGGQLTDNDYLTADGGNPSLVTHSNLSNNATWYLNIDGGLRAYTFRDQRGWVDLFAGLQYWYQRSNAYGVTQTTCTAAGASVDINPSQPGVQRLCSPGAAPVSGSVLAITNTSRWYSVRTGGQMDYQLTRHIGLRSTITLLPVSVLDNSDVHHLRTDLQQNPSFSMLGIGVGADVDAGVYVTIVKNLSVNVGYRMWWNRILTGTLTGYEAGGPSSSYTLTQFQSYRHGTTFGISYTF